LRDKPQILMNIQGKYSEIIVDEFQDINKLDFEFIKMISQRATLVVTGDDCTGSKDLGHKGRFIYGDFSPR